MARKSSIVGRGVDAGRRLTTGFAEFAQTETAGGVVLLAATVVALIIANTPAWVYLDALEHVVAGVRVGGWELFQSLRHWVDDGLMAVFFLVVGLEIKREFVAGELADRRKAALPVIAAVGGMIVPALIYLAFNAGGVTQRGWAVPMATDIAFVLGMVALLGKRAPKGLRLFLTTLAIADDIGAILVIAVFYSRGIAWPWLLAGLGLLALLAVLNRMGVDSLLPFVCIGLVVWFCFLNSGVHATIAGVLVAFTIPSRSRTEPLRFVEYARARLSEIEAFDRPGAHVLESTAQQDAAFEVCRVASQTAAPLQRLEHALLPFSTFVVLPVFALFNASVRFVGYDFSRFATEPLVIGIFLGLLLGKPIGIGLATFATVRLGVSDLPEGLTWRHVVGGGVLAGIGFTMSLFVANLAFTDLVLLTEARLAILVTSFVAGVLGYLALRFFTGSPEGAGAER